MAVIAAALVLLVAAGAIFAVLRKRKGGPADSGEEGEREAARFLNSVSAEGDKLICDLILTNPETGMTAQIDHILLSARGIFVVETKNYAGVICGSDGEGTWRQFLPGTENDFYSPVKQNATHIYVIKKVTQTKLYLENVVLFPRADIGRVQSESVYSFDAFAQRLSSLKPLYTAQERDGLYDALLALKRENSVTKREHIRNIRAGQKKLKKKICPRCGGKLVRQKGPHGRVFICSTPGCTFTME